MTGKSDKIKQARWSLIQNALDEVCNVPDYNNFRRNVFCVIASFGLQLKAKEEKLFETGDWHNPECRGELTDRLTLFLTKYIR